MRRFTEQLQSLQEQQKAQWAECDQLSQQLRRVQGTLRDIVSSQQQQTPPAFSAVMTSPSGSQSAAALCSVSGEPMIWIRPRTAEEWATYYSRREELFSSLDRTRRVQAAQKLQRVYRSTRLQKQWQELILRMSSLNHQKSIMAAWSEEGARRRAALTLQRAWRYYVMRLRWIGLIAKVRGVDPAEVILSFRPKSTSDRVEINHARGDHLVLDPDDTSFVYPFGRRSALAAEQAAGQALSSSSSSDDSLASLSEESSVGGDALVVERGTLVQLVEHLCWVDLDDRKFVETFLLMLPTICSPSRFFRLLKVRYQVPQDPSWTAADLEQYHHTYIAPQQSHVLNILHVWVDNHFAQILTEPGLVQAVKDFFAAQLDKGLYRSKLESLVRLLSHQEFLFSDQAFLRGRMTADEYIEFMSGEDRRYIPSRLDDPVRFENVDPEILARQWTFIESGLFRDIDVARELFNNAWTKQNKAKLAPHVLVMSERTEQMTQWTTTQLLVEPNAKARARLLAHFILVAEQLRLLGNFNGLWEVYGGLSDWTFSRLKATWALLPAKVVHLWENLSDLMTVDGNHKGYRRAYPRQPHPRIPQLPVVLGDLFKSYDINPDTCEQPPGAPPEAVQINFAKRTVVARQLALVVEDQKHLYRISPIPALQQLLICGSYLTATERGEVTYAREPRGGARAAKSSRDNGRAGSFSFFSGFGSSGSKDKVAAPASPTPRQAMHTFESGALSAATGGGSSSNLHALALMSSAVSSSESSPQRFLGVTSGGTGRSKKRAGTMHLPSGTWEAMSAAMSAGRSGSEEDIGRSGRERAPSLADSMLPFPSRRSRSPKRLSTSNLFGTDKSTQATPPVAAAAGSEASPEVSRRHPATLERSRSPKKGSFPSIFRAGSKE